MAHSHNGTAQLTCPACNYGPFTRNNYFTGKLLVERDFTDETPLPHGKAAPPRAAPARLGRGLRSESQTASQRSLPRPLRLRGARFGGGLLRP